MARMTCVYQTAFTGSGMMDTVMRADTRLKNQHIH